MVARHACILALALGAAGCASPQGEPTGGSRPGTESPMRLGNFSVSLSVKNLAASRDFYEKLGFRAVGGDAARNWLVLQNGSATIGLFQGMFERNTLTFNPGWNSAKETLADFDDVRELQRMLAARGLVPTVAVDETTTGPGFLMLTDPDGNPILIDQHVASPAK